MEFKRFEGCEFLRKGSRNPVTNLLVNIFNDTAPGFLHPCPYKVVNVTKAPINVGSVRGIFATGDYKIHINFSNEDNKPLFSAYAAISVNSSDKFSFG